MHPYIDLIFIKVPSYGVMLSLAFIVSLFLAVRRGIRKGIDSGFIGDLAFWTVISGIIGGRAYFVIEHWNHYKSRPWEFFYLWEGGLGIYGALFAGVLFGFIYIKVKKLPFLKVADISFSVLPLGQSIGRIGCFMAGCCYGRPCESPLGVVFTDPHSLAPIGIKVYPTQLFESIGSFLIFLLLSIVFNKSKVDGTVTSFYLILYGILRFLVELYRGDPRSFVGLLSVPQVLSLLLIVAGILIYYARRR